MKIWGFASALIGLAVLAGAAAGQTTLPTSLPAPPPGTIAKTKSCAALGAVHELARYRSGLGCLLGNMTLAVLSPQGVDEAWARSVDATAFELARYGSTVSPEEPEALYIIAAKIDLAAIATPNAPPTLKNVSCAAASNATEEACVAFFCASEDPVRVQSAELGALTAKVAASCGTTPRCLPKDLDVNRATCHVAWLDKQRVLSGLIRTRQDLPHGSYTAQALEAVKDWTARADRLADQVRESALGSQYQALPALVSAADQAAAPALLKVETERTANLQKKLVASLAEQKVANSSSCGADATAACRIERKAATEKVSRLKDAVKFQEFKLEQAQTVTDPKARVKILQSTQAVAPLR